MRRAAKQGSVQAQAVVKIVEPPDELAYLLTWLHELRSRNQRGMHYEPIPFTEMEAYGRLYELEMTPFDVDMLCALDQLWCAQVPKAVEKT